MRMALLFRFRSAAVVVAALAALAVRADPVTFVFTSDVHYGFFRGQFRTFIQAKSQVVNAAAIERINALPSDVFPSDGGLSSGKAVGPVDFVVITGDITNRQEMYPIRIQSSAESWSQFESGYVSSLTLRDRSGHRTPLLIVPGNHDASNAIGAPSKLMPPTDATSMAGIYNAMLHPATPLTKDTFQYARDKVRYTRDFGGAHCIFLTLWPDSASRAWIAKDLEHVSATTPVFLFAHDPPEADARHFINPNGNHSINKEDNFDNILGDTYADGKESDGSTDIEQRAFADFLRAHRNIVAYFHGHQNYNEFYTWKGPDGDLDLKVFRADSPMKGKFSGKDEKKISFQVVVYDTALGQLTSRECLWNQRPGGIAWGESKTVAISPR